MAATKGTATPTFTDGNGAVFICTVGGIAQQKPVTRRVVTVPGAFCK